MTSQLNGALIICVACMQFLPVIDGKGQEKQLLQNVLNKVMAENTFDGLDVNKACCTY